ncbi:MAG: 3-deoxy-7-phosphoheptulonate synthase, partial [Halieaceae bacterium]
ASSPHRFLGMDYNGLAAVIHTRGNQHAHIVLRGGSGGPNYDSLHVKLSEVELANAGLPLNIMVDCSHANSAKKPELQPLVAENVLNQIIEGNESLVGLMIESNINAGNQSIPDDLSQLKYGVSVTDGCIDWDTTETAIRDMAERLREVLPLRKRA